MHPNDAPDLFCALERLPDKFRRAAKCPIQWSKEFDLAFADVTDMFYRQS